MNKNEFLQELGKRLSGLPQEDIDERLGFYSEMIDDRVEEGVSEEDAVAGIGSMDDIVSQILHDYPLKKIVKEKIMPKRKLSVFEIILLVIGSPVWIAILLALVAVALSLYISLWAIIVSLCAVDVALCVCAPAGLIAAIIALCQENGLLALLLFGGALVCAGLAIFLFFGCKLATKGIIKLTPQISVQSERSKQNEKNS